MAGLATPTSIEKTNQSQKKGVKAPLLLVMAGPVVTRSIEKKKQKKGAKIPPLLAMAGLVVPISTRKKEKKRKTEEPKLHCCWQWWRAKLPHLYWQW
jgi:hypothetical protein